MSESKSSYAFEYDKYHPRSYAMHISAYGHSSVRAEVLLGECDICEKSAPVLQMDNLEAGPISACRECIATLFDVFEKGTPA
jgi:hypothetical protein